MIELRDYQRACLNKIIWARTNTNLQGNDLVILPTGAGKSVVIASIASTLNEPVLILQPSKEILEQNYSKLCQYVNPDDIGLYSASVGSKEIARYTLATIQSIYKNPDYFRHFKLVIIDEAHLVNPKNLNGMFTSFLKAIGNPRVIGLTATPYRMDTKYEMDGQMLYVTGTTKLINRMKSMFWQRILFNMNIGELIDQGYLCPLEYHDETVVRHEEIPVNTQGTDFDKDKLDEVMLSKRDRISLVISHAKATSKSVLVFCTSVRQAEQLSEETECSAVVSSKTKARERDQIIQGFKDGEIKCVFNVGVLTTGFDHPSLDCIVLLRPTRSIALYYQMIGRGVRKSPGKTTCKVIDMTSTVKYLGRVETIKLVKRDKWELESETGSWHNVELFRWRHDPEKRAEEREKENFYEQIRRGEI